MSEVIRVLQIVTTMNRGGLETMLMNYYRNINRDKVQFDFLIHRQEESDYEQEILELGGKTYHISNLNPFSINYRKELKTFFKDHPEYKIVHCHLDCMSSIPLYYARKAGIRTRIAHSHTSSQDKNFKYPLKLFYKKKISKYANYLFACGKSAGNWMFGNQDYRIINNAIDTKQFIFDEKIRKDLRDKYGINDKFVVGHVGRFNEVKNHNFIIDVFNELQKINSESYLFLVGTGELEEVVKAKVNDLHLENNVCFFGLTNKVNEILQVFDVFVFPSLYEGLPVTMVEVQASGLKSFISDKVSSECVITNNVNILQLNDSPLVWAKELNNLSRGYSRKNMLKTIEEKGFDIEENAKQLEDFYINEYR